MNISEYALGGGLKLTTPPSLMKAGELLDCLNVECLVDGGYGLISGYAKHTDQEVPGEGPVLGVHIYKGETYAVRDGATQGHLYKLNNGDWVEVVLPNAWSKGGSYLFKNHNFKAQDDQIKMFIVNGIDKAISFDGATALEIDVGDGPHNASKVIGFDSKLVLCIESSLFFSKAGEPEDYSGTSGAAEVAIGETVNELFISQGALIVGCKNSTQVIYSAYGEGLKPNKLNDNGVLTSTMNSIGGQVISLDSPGLTALLASKNFGNFDSELISNNVKPLFRSLFSNSSKPVSVLSRRKSQYRIFFGKLGLYLTFSSRGLAGITQVSFEHSVDCTINSEDSFGIELALFGSSNGFVYEMDNSTKFDGQPILNFMMLSFNDSNNPTRRKRYRKVAADIKAFGEIPDLYFQPLLDYGGKDTAASTRKASIDSLSGGALWDFSKWDQFKWDSRFFSSVVARISGVGKNMSLIISSDGEVDGYFEIYGITQHHSQRGLER